VTVANDERSTLLVAVAPVPLHVDIYLGLERDREHPFGSASADLVQGGREVLADLLARGYPEHRRISFRRRVLAGGSDQRSTGGYAASIIRSRIHNFRSYLVTGRRVR
jgi:hypothetical protein